MDVKDYGDHKTIFTAEELNVDYNSYAVLITSLAG
jgi:hypothetical protein